MTLWLAVSCALALALTNGFHDAANAIATLVVAPRGPYHFQKLNLRDRVQAVIFAYESGLVEIGAVERNT